MRSPTVYGKKNCDVATGGGGGWREAGVTPLNNFELGKLVKTGQTGKILVKNERENSG